MQSNDPLRPFKNNDWRYLNLMDQLLPDAVPCGSLVFTPSLTSPPISINMDTFDTLQTDSPTLITDKQSSGMYVGSSTAGISNSVDPKFEELVKFGDKLIDVGSHTGDNHPPLSCSPSLSTNSSCISKCRCLHLRSLVSSHSPSIQLADQHHLTYHSYFLYLTPPIKNLAPHIHGSARLSPPPQCLMVLQMTLCSPSSCRASNRRLFRWTICLNVHQRIQTPQCRPMLLRTCGTSRWTLTWMHGHTFSISSHQALTLQRCTISL